MKTTNLEIIREFNRRFNIGDTVRHFKWFHSSMQDRTEMHGMYVILGIGKSTVNEEYVVIYRAMSSDGTVWIRPMIEFVSAVDEDKYPNAFQTYRFETVSETDVK